MARTPTSKRILQTGALFLVVEAVTVAVLAGYTQLEVRKEKYETLLNTITAARFMALVPTEYPQSFSQALYDTGYASLIDFLTHGQTQPVGADVGITTYHTLYIKRIEDLPATPSPEIQQALTGTVPFAVSERANAVAVAVPLFRSGEAKPYGVLRIETETEYLVTEVVRKNAALYVLILVLVNGQVIAVLVMLSRRAVPMPLERGYLKEHAIGALKLQHKILGDIIADHDRVPPADEAPQPTRTQPTPIIPLSGKER